MARPETNGNLHGALKDKDSHTSVNKYVDKVKKGQDSILRLYIT
jgi:hypothetical protein